MSCSFFGGVNTAAVTWPMSVPFLTEVGLWSWPGVGRNCVDGGRVVKGTVWMELGKFSVNLHLIDFSGSMLEVLVRDPLKTLMEVMPQIFFRVLARGQI